MIYIVKGKKNPSLMFYFVILLNLCLAYFVKGKCSDTKMYQNVSEMHPMMTENRRNELDSSRILIELINLSGYVLKDIVSLSSFQSLPQPQPSENNNDHKHPRIFAIDSRDKIGVMSVGVFFNKTTPLWQNEEKQKALRY